MPEASVASAPAHGIHAGALSRYALPALSFAAAFALYRRVAYELAMDWWTVPAQTQGLLIPPLAAWIAWMTRDRTLALPARPDARGLLLVAASCVMALAGRLAAEFFLSRMAMVALAAGAVWCFHGWPRLRALAFPFGLLAAAVPLPALVYNRVAAPLQLLATDIAARAAEAAGVSVYTDGNIIHLAGLSLGVEEACSGLNSLSALLVGGILLAFLQCSGRVSRIALVLLSVPAAIAANILRVAGTAVLADVNARYALGFYHAFSGWLVFVAGFAGLAGAGWLLHRLEARS